MFRVIKAVTDDDVANAVHAARAVVKLADRNERLTEDLAARDEKIAQLRASSERQEQGRRRLVKLIQAVENLHEEVMEVACGDGCCHNGTGVCSYCGEPYPCKTVRAVDPDLDPPKAEPEGKAT